VVIGQAEAVVGDQHAGAAAEEDEPLADVARALLDLLLEPRRLVLGRPRRRTGREDGERAQLAFIVPAQRALEFDLFLAAQDLHLDRVAGRLLHDRLASVVEGGGLPAVELDDDVLRLDPGLLGGMARGDALDLDPSFAALLVPDDAQERAA
jgi:hypothetical protein